MKKEINIFEKNKYFIVFYVSAFLSTILLSPSFNLYLSFCRLIIKEIKEIIGKNNESQLYFNIDLEIFTSLLAIIILIIVIKLGKYFYYKYKKLKEDKLFTKFTINYFILNITLYYVIFGLIFEQVIFDNIDCFMIYIYLILSVMIWQLNKYALTIQMNDNFSSNDDT